VVATDSVSIGTHKEGTLVKAKISGDVMKDAAVGGGVPTTADLIIFSSGKFVSVILVPTILSSIPTYIFAFLLFSYVSVISDHSYLTFPSLR
jgi:hypothetical protein